MSDGKLRVLAKGTAQVPHYEKLEGGINARITHACLAIGPEFQDEETRQMRRHAAFVKHVGVVLEVPDRGEYRRHLRDGDLWPADIETANAVGVSFDPDFGGEHHDAAKAEHCAALQAMVKADPKLEPMLRPHIEKLGETPIAEHQKDD